MSKKLLESVANLLHQTGYNEVACVLDCDRATKDYKSTVILTKIKKIDLHPATQGPVLMMFYFFLN